MIASVKSNSVISRTTLQLLHVLGRWSEILNEGGAVDSIYFDFTKAFDTVPHAHLISKLYMYNISPIVIDWVKAFLTDRNQQVRVSSNCSRPRKVWCSTGQCSRAYPLCDVH